MSTAAIRRHWDALRAMGCIVWGTKERVTLHHCHSGSMAEEGWNRGGAERMSDWLTIPLHIELHSMGPLAIDGSCGVLTWERMHGRQVDHLNTICERFGIDVWALARAEPRKVMLPRRFAA